VAKSEPAEESLAKPLKRPPRELAETIIAQLEAPQGLVTRTEIAGPGFINFWLADAAVAEVLPDILAAGASWGRSTTGRGRSVNVEFVSANPTGPLHVGHGRGALLAVLGERRIAVHSYAPASIKKALTGNGRAPKDRVAKMVGQLLGTADLTTDATDALATALAHAFAAKAQMLMDQ